MKLTKTLLKEMVREAFKDRDFPSMTDKRSRQQMRADAGVHIPDALSGEPETATSLAQAMGSEEPDAAERLEGGVVDVDVQKMTDKHPKIKAAFQYVRGFFDDGDWAWEAFNELKKFINDGEYTIYDEPYNSRDGKINRVLKGAIEHAGWEKGVDYEEEKELPDFYDSPILMRHNFTRYKNLLPKTKRGDDRAYNWHYPKLK